MSEENKNDWSVLEAELNRLYKTIREMNPTKDPYASLWVSLFGSEHPPSTTSIKVNYKGGLGFDAPTIEKCLKGLSMIDPEKSKQERIEKLRAELHSLGAPVMVVCGTCGEEKPDNRMADCDECIRQQDAVQPDPRGELMDDRRDAAYERRNRE